MSVWPLVASAPADGASIELVVDARAVASGGGVATDKQPDAVVTGTVRLNTP